MLLPTTIASLASKLGHLHIWDICVSVNLAIYDPQGLALVPVVLTEVSHWEFAHNCQGKRELITGDTCSLHVVATLLQMRFRVCIVFVIYCTSKLLVFQWRCDAQ